MYAWLQEERHKPEHAAKRTGPPRLLALGDPAFARRYKPKPPDPTPPDHGVVITMIAPGSNSAQAGIKPGDVVLEYGGIKLSKATDLAPAMAQAGKAGAASTRGAKGIPVQVWRDGKTFEVTVAPGKLGIRPSDQAAAQAVRAWRQETERIRSTRGDTYPPLPGTRREVEAIARLFPSPLKLLGSEADEQRLDQLAATGDLGRFRYLHFATHGDMNARVAMRSALVLAQDNLPEALDDVLAGKEVRDGRVTAEHMLHHWHLDADLVTLSACRTGVAEKFEGGEGYVGFAQALFLAGARSLVLSLWKVDDTATALLMTRFYQNLLGKRKGLDHPLPKAEALAEAKHWLRSLKDNEAQAATAALPRGSVVPLGSVRPAPRSVQPYGHPYYWAAFILIGDPG
jgi:CHAT domain-containing protein